ncbi:ATP-binding protein [Streptomyces sp. ATCC51928]|uniref:RNA-binding domain-containing protein n=1 Tax=Streptomyces caviscabies TaxID=90079 RepID=A0ABW2M6E9_9ACTN|nr:MULTISPECIES: ATP-binding protein [unclassified Streptomyces]MDX3501288.1 ATP-binding protein [Streptomyces sp. ATCC51928]MDX5521594.1 ATP-binding protein [Streptomyces sp. DE06-01C]
MEGRTISRTEASSILTRQENHFWDFKSSRSDGPTVQKISSAFANAEGGEFIVGIEDPKVGSGIERWQGFKTIEDANWVQQSLVDQVDPPVPYDIEYLRVSGFEESGWACLVTVQKSPDVHKTAKGDVHQRRGGENARLRGSQITDLSLSKGARSYEDQPLEDYDLDELQQEEELHHFLGTYSPKMSAEKFIRRQRLIDRKTSLATVAGAVLFSEEPPTVVPKRCSVKIARYETSEQEPDRKYLKDAPASIDGPARVLIDDTLAAVTQIIQSVPVLNADGSMSPMNYPPEALKEIIVNAVIHRDYNISDDILISVFDNRVEVRSPGKLPGHMTQENLFTDRFARNPTIVRLLNKYPDAPNKDIGEGLDTVLSTMKAAKLKAPRFTVHENAFVVVLEHTPLARPEELVLEYLASNEEIANRVARQLTGINSENNMKRVFYKLRDAGKIEPVPNRSRAKAAWQLKKSE